MRARPVVLVADDNPAVRAALKDALASEGVDLVEASDGDGALSQLHRARPDAMVLDLRMPGVGGDAILDHLARTARHDVPCLVITGAPEVPAWIGKLPHVRVLRKPFGAAEVRAALRATLAMAGEGGPGPGGAEAKV